MGEDIKITYETLFDLFRREKSRDELQKLDDSFYQDVLDYLKEKMQVEDSSHNSGFSPDVEKAQVQLQNIKRLIKGIYEKRERKVFQMAINKVRIGSDIIDTSVLLDNEKIMYNELIELLSKHRKDVLFNVLQAQPPKGFEPKPSNLEKNVELAPESVESKKTSSEAFEKPLQGKQEANVKIKFLGSVPKFVGRNLEIFGPFEKGEEKEIPESIALILIQKQKAEQV